MTASRASYSAVVVVVWGCVLQDELKNAAEELRERM